MDNLKQAAYPLINQEGASLEDKEVQYGFTKLELASLMIAQGIAQREFVDTGDREYISVRAVKLAKAILEEANK